MPAPKAKKTLSHRAQRHQSTRLAHATELAEDYVETIADLIASQGEARVVDIAAALGVSHVTVTRTVGRLQREKLVSTKPYRAIFLTPSGKALAEHATRRHRIVVDFLRALGVSEKTAETDAEGLEHHVSRETLAAMEALVKRSSRK